MIHYFSKIFNGAAKYFFLFLICFSLAGCGVKPIIGESGEKAPDFSAAPKIPAPKSEPGAAAPQSAAPQSTGEAGADKTPVPAGTPQTPAPGGISPTNAPTPAPGGAPSALSNKTSGWGYRRNKGGRPEFTAAQTKLMKEYGCIFLSDAGEKNLYLTFDEGYENGYTPIILDVLKEQKVPAAFFVTGPYVKKEGALIKRMLDEGHIVGNHSVSHPSLPALSEREISDEIKGLDDMFFDLTGGRMKYLRPPRGEYSERTLALTRDLGFTNVFWSFAYKDWETDNQKGADYAFDFVTGELHDGAVILLHAVSKDNAAALERIITHARGEGYAFRSLDDFR